MDYIGKKSGKHTGKTCQYSGRKLCLDDELLMVLVFLESDLANHFYVKQSTGSRIFPCGFFVFYFSGDSYLAFIAAHKQVHAPFLSRKYPFLQLSLTLQSFRCISLQILMDTLRHGRNIRTKTHLSSLQVSFLMGVVGLDKQLTIWSDLFDLLEPRDMTDNI